MSITVLIADDHAVVRDGLRLLLETQPDIRVVGEVADGREAVEAVLRLKPDVVLMDLAMPVLNGADATKLILEKRENTRIVMLSMRSTAEHVFRALQAGALGYLRKESAGSEVVDAVRTVHGGRRYLSQKITESVVDDYIRKRAVDSPLESLSQRERELASFTSRRKRSIPIAAA